MSIVLDALEKAQKEQRINTELQKNVALPSIEIPINFESINDILPEEQKIKTDRTTKLHLAQLLKPNKINITLFIAIIAVASINLWLGKGNSINSTTSVSSVPVKKPHVVVPAPPSATKIFAIKNILLDNNSPPQLKVTGVVRDEKGPVALVNSKFLKEGDEILGVKVVKIQPREVLFLYKGKEFTISVE